MVTDTIEAGVLALISDLAGKRDWRLDQRLYHDLRLTGDDAYELLEDIQKRFGTKFDNMDFHRFFSAAPDLLTSLIEKWFPSVITETPVTIGHLVDVVRAGRWFDPPD